MKLTVIHHQRQLLQEYHILQNPFCIVDNLHVSIFRQHINFKKVRQVVNNDKIFVIQL